MSYVSEVLADSPLVYWPLNDVSPVQDSSGNSLPSTAIVGSPSYQNPGPMVGSFALGMIGNESISRAIVSTAQNSFTMELWFNVTAVTNNDQIVIYNGSSGSNGWGVVMDTTRKIQYLCGGVAFGTLSNFVVTAGTWYHVCVVRRVTQWEYWFNGVIDTAGLGTTNPAVPSGGAFVLSGSTSLQGYWSNVAIYNSALSGGRILAHFKAAQEVLRNPAITVPTQSAARW